ncbi:MAG: hypothetical protein ACRDD1_16360 [Planctomycetia bacterium]
MLDILIPLSPLLVTLAFVVWHAGLRRACPDCDAPLPLFYSPFRKTRRMWRAGGYLCAACGCESDSAGRKVTADTPMPPIPVGLWAFAGFSALLGLGLAAWLAAGRAVEPSVLAVAPPIVVTPQQGPPAIPAP